MKIDGSNLPFKIMIQSFGFLKFNGLYYRNQINRFNLIKFFSIKSSVNLFFYLVFSNSFHNFLEFFKIFFYEWNG